MGKRIATLEAENILGSIATLPEPLRQEAETQFTFGAGLRHGSATFERKTILNGYPDLAITDHDRRNMARMVANKASYRVVEVIYHLHEVEGNDVYRCVKSIMKKDKVFAKEIRPVAKANGVKLPKVK